MTSASEDGGRYHRTSPEFGRVVNLSDAVFAIAMTLLALTLDVPVVAADALGGALLDRLPQLVAFGLGFALVANVWWAHHKIFRRLEALEPGLIAINMVALALVALVPFPTSLIGTAPTASAAAVPFIGLFAILILVFLLLHLRARAVGAWLRPMPDEVVPWLLADWLGSFALMAIALLVAVWLPLGGLVIAALSGTAVGVTMALRAPAAYRDWSR